MYEWEVVDDAYDVDETSKEENRGSRARLSTALVLTTSFFLWGRLDKGG